MTKQAKKILTIVLVMMLAFQGLAVPVYAADTADTASGSEDGYTQPNRPTLMTIQPSSVSRF